VHCPAFQDLEQFVLGQLSEAQAARVEEHLEQCAHCVDALGLLQGADPLLETLRTSEAATQEIETEVIEDLIGRLKALPACQPASDTELHTLPLPATMPSAAEASPEPRPYSFLAPPQQPDEIGRLGPYRVLQVLGTGGMGVVFQAEDLQLQRLVALKVVKPELAASTGARQRFQREARAAAALTHDHIVTIYQVGEDRGVPFLAMQLLQGESLEDRLRRQLGPQGAAPLAVAEALRIGRQIAEGLAAAHEHGLIHRDIKPANIWLEARQGDRETRRQGDKAGVPSVSLSPCLPVSLSPSFRVKLLDFGLARVIDDDERVTDPGTIAGTPQYMAPEQAEGKGVDARCDLFSLGCVLYRLCTGDVPFKGTGTLGVLRALALEQPRPPRELNPEVPPELSDLILRLLAKKPANRLPSARAAAEALAALAARLPAGDEAADSSTVLQGDKETRRQGDKETGRRPRGLLVSLSPYLLVWTAAAVLLVGLGASGIVLRIKHKDGRVTEINLQEGDTLEIDGSGQPLVKPPPVPPVVLNPLSPLSTVTQPAALKGVQGWTLVPQLPWADVHELSFSPDGRWLAVACDDGVVRIWDTATATQLRILAGHTAGLWCVTWSPDGKQLASGGPDRTVRVWDAASGRCLHVLRGHAAAVSTLAWSPDGKTLASGGERDDAMVKLWDPATGQLRQTLRRHKGTIKTVSWSPDSKRLVSASFESTLRFWDAESGRPLPLNQEQAGPLHNPVWSPDGKKVACRTSDRGVRVLDPDTGRTLHRIRGQNIDSEIAWLPDSRRLVFGCLTSTLKVWDTAAGKAVQTLDNQAYGVWHVALSPDGTQLATSTAGARIRVFDLASGKLRHAVTPPLAARPQAVAWAPGGKLLATGSSDRSVRLWDVSSGALLRALDHGDAVHSLAFAADGKTLASGGGNGSVRFWDLETGQAIGEQSLNGPVFSLAWLPGNREFAAVGGEARIRDAESGLVLRTLEGSAEFARCLALSPDGTKVAAGGAGAAQVWDARSGEPLHRLQAHTGKLVSSLAWSPHGKHLAAGIDSEGLAVRIWDVDLSQSRAAFETEFVLAVAWSPNGSKLASAGRDGMVRVWDPSSAKPLLWERLADAEAVVGVAWSPDGRALASTGAGAVRLWDGASGRPLGVLRLLADQLWLAVGPDGYYRGTPALERQLLHVVQTDQGQRTLTPEEFAREYGWKNDSRRVRLLGP
jgi:WD40 repeat protein/serine/threonine protein kinase